jgi:Tfp pilus assembly protein PilF
VAYHDDRPYLEYTTSRRRATSEIEIVQKLSYHLDPIATMIEGGPDADTLMRIDQIRERNLRDIVAQAIKRDAQELRRSGRIDDAIDRLEEAVTWNAENVEINLLLADALLARDKIFVATDYLETAVRIDPGNAKAQFGRGYVLHRMGRLNEAIHHYSESVRLDSDQAEVHNNLGTAMAQQQDWAGAAKHFSRALQIDPDDSDARNKLAQVRSIQGRNSTSNPE